MEEIEYKRRVSEEEDVKNKKVRVSQEDFDEDQALSQAVLFADTLGRKFLPITLERPKVLLPLLNIPIIEYTLTWLHTHGVKQVFVLCCDDDCFEQVGSYLKNSTWFSAKNFAVTMMHNRRFADLLDIIHGDFVIVGGDIVSDMCIQEAHKVHKERRKKDRDAVMTMVVNMPERDMYTNETLCGYDELHTKFADRTGQLLYYEYDDVHDYYYSLGNALPITHPVNSATCCFQDCHIYICSGVVLTLLLQFDKLPRMDRFVQMVLKEMPKQKIFTHKLWSGYTDRVDRFRSYDTISQDLIRKLRNTSESDVQLCGCCLTKPDGQDGIYRKLVLGQSRFREYLSVVGNETTIKPSSTISNSVIGKGCTIGSSCRIEDSYIWDDVIIEEGCCLSNAIICDGVVIKSRSCIGPGMILSFKVEVGPQFRLKENGNLKVSLVSPRGQDDLVSANACMCRKLDLQNGNFIENSSDTSELGASAAGFGFIWCCEGYEGDWRNRISPREMMFSPLDEGCTCL